MTAGYEEITIWRKVGPYAIEGRVTWNPECFNGTAVLFVLPWTAEEENIYHWTVRISRALAVDGNFVLRYHPAGYGDSTELQAGDSARDVALQAFQSFYSFLQNSVDVKAVTVIAVRSGAWLVERLTDNSAVRLLYIEPLLTEADILREERRRGALGDHAVAGLTPLDLPKTTIQHSSPVEIIACGLTRDLSFNVRRAIKKLAGRVTTSHGVVCPAFWENMDPPVCTELNHLVQSLFAAGENPSRPALPSDWVTGDAEVPEDRESVTIPVGTQTLAGTLYPATGQTTGAIVLCSGYRTGRNGPAGLLRFLAERLSAMGYFCLLFDYPGRGDREGTPELRMEEMAVAAASAVDWLSANRGLPLITVLGICAGAEAALRASILNPAVNRLLLLSASFPGGITPEKLRKTGFLARLYGQLRRFDLRTTLPRLLRGQLNLSAIRRVLAGQTPAMCCTQTAPEAPPDFAQVHAQQAFIVAAQRNDEDRAARDFYCKRLKGIAAVTCQNIESEDHNFTAPQERAALVKVLQNFLNGPA